MSLNTDTISEKVKEEKRKMKKLSIIVVLAIMSMLVIVSFGYSEPWLDNWMGGWGHEWGGYLPATISYYNLPTIEFPERLQPQFPIVDIGFPGVTGFPGLIGRVPTGLPSIIGVGVPVSSYRLQYKPLGVRDVWIGTYGGASVMASGQNWDSQVWNQPIRLFDKSGVVSGGDNVGFLLRGVDKIGLPTGPFGFISPSFGLFGSSIQGGLTGGPFRDVWIGTYGGASVMAPDQNWGSQVWNQPVLKRYNQYGLNEAGIKIMAPGSTGSGFSIPVEHDTLKAIIQNVR